MSQPAVVTTGEDWTLPVQLVENGVAVDITGDTIEAAVVDRLGNRVAGPVTADPDHALADLAAGLAVPVIPAASTTGLSAGMYQIEVRRTHAGTPTTWPRQLLQVQVGVIP
jgi:hypothetical protein